MEPATHLFKDWHTKHGHLFVSHATDNYAAIFNSGTLMCAEEILRTRGQVEHEVGTMGDRQLSRIDSLPKTDSNQYVYLYYERISKRTQASRLVYLIPKSAEKGWGWLLTKYTTKEDYGLFWKLKSPPNDPTAMRTAERICSDIDFDIFGGEPKEPHHPFFKRIDGTKSSRMHQTVSLSDDEKQGRSVDQELSAIYQYAVKKGVCPERLSRTLYKIRSMIFGQHGTRIDSSIRVGKNSVWWSYGKVAILIGNPKEKLFSLYGPKGGQDFDASEKGEFCLKEPFQVERGFYQIKIDSDENLIIGPRAILDPFRHLPVARRFVDIESLNEILI